MKMLLNLFEIIWDPKGRRLTAVVETVELAEVASAEAHPLTDHVQKLWDLGDDGGCRAGTEGRFAVVHDGAIVVGDTESTGHRVVTYFEVVLLIWEYHKRRSDRAQSSFGSRTDSTSRASLSIDLTQHYWIESGPTRSGHSHRGQPWTAHARGLKHEGTRAQQFPDDRSFDQWTVVAFQHAGYPQRRST